MKVLVTGGCGFIGSHLVDELVRQNYTVTVIDNLSTGNIENLNPKAIFYQRDIRDYESIKKYFIDKSVVFHLAALPKIQPSFVDPILHEEVNVIGTINCLLASKNHGIKKFIFSGSSSVYGNTDDIPTSESSFINCLNPYALQKYTAEQYCFILGKKYDLPVVSLRYFNPYGPRSFNSKNPYNAYTSVVGIFNYQSKTTKTLTVTGSGKQSRDFIHIYDLIQASVLASKKKIKNEIINIGFGKSISVNQLASYFKCKISYIPERKGEALITCASISKAKKLLNWEPKIDLKYAIDEEIL
ncbi:MAG: hypothetical protein CMG57_08595 [Candidatus Marinimicrobia bacterium]|nr:hypothetical protein [Candidatus Neomarinimicrobiota bacterium]|tara:strand:+ start:13353 stop:14249 length:897 start_codon:yes stop_codon:yes gene_type:complete